ncbi:HAMP domain-containing sensor histidine kinase [Jeotgalibacillus sp. ET6]|uniref:sensor histidine kinase n=1 Tax=Jeotgalibacillus sp. ET6 TaxID=3037260 RepID=UPI0024187075|nr:HAMP domain-containing sensor histidine kinase [Jeotgalibacillus sp. ET6]MDG5472115.1 HAMP domain-containing sensor histidine kinase [Jeotgalibacillus sp. ET6]
MSLHKHFLLQFFLQLIFVCTVLVILTIAFFGLIGYNVMEEEIIENLNEADQDYIASNVKSIDDNVIFEEKIKGLADLQDGWLMAVSLEGEVKGSYQLSENKSTFSKSELASMMAQNEANAFWEINEDDTTYTVLFGKRQTASNLLDLISKEWDQGELTLSKESEEQLQLLGGWIQVLDEGGNEVDFAGEKERNVSYSLTELLSLAKNDPETAISYNEEAGQTLIVGLPPSKEGESEEKFIKRMGIGFLIFSFLVMMIVMIGAFWYASKFAVPLLTIMKWIQNLGSGIFAQPMDRHQRSLLENKKGKLKRKYRLYKELITTLSYLTSTLKENEQQRKRMTQTREEWISGLSHDLKTPLSSITGYAQMLQSDQYSWNESEVREFAGTMTEKSAYMMNLLEDLTLSYRIKNQALSIAKEKTDLNEFVRRTIIHYINDPNHYDIHFTFEPQNDEANVFLDPKWFRRIMDNIISNAISYNPKGTTIKISVSLIDKHLAVIVFEDDGVGMDHRTLDQLFERYYRGTNTSDSGNGSGLGMAITKQLVNLHNGTINVKSEPGKGTTVRIILPVGEEPREALEA